MKHKESSHNILLFKKKKYVDSRMIQLLQKSHKIRSMNHNLSSLTFGSN